MTELEQQILDIIQDGFPIVERPYAAIAEKLNECHSETCKRHSERSEESGRDEQQVFEVVESLRSSGVIRRIGGVYDTKRLGLVSRLCAGKIPTVATGAADDSALEQFATAVMGVSAITHNYVRSHDYNVWFTVIAENETALQAVIDKLCSETKLRDVHSMPAKRMFKINTVMGRKTSPVDSAGGLPGLTEGVSAQQSRLGVAVLAESDKTRIRLLSGNLPHSLTPFTDLFRDVLQDGNMNLAGVLAQANDDLAAKRMRRFGAVLRHQQAGYSCNAMVCFDVSCSSVVDVSRAGALLAANPHVSHCYERPPFEGFPYNVYAMFHAQSEAELRNFVAEAVDSLGKPDFAVLHSVRELKKTSYKYFSE